ncbi:hypothetical protein IWW38_004949 [Coemansia aciculifera]|uniref:Uncharacterized protein n=1 Tax=Coemansia aciculifera TaxID=417176 RepID=A0ACC1LWE8_9FUNG|nr:hypothetical protein IWW38_004949 [Coemansia aciculifera]
MPPVTDAPEDTESAFRPSYELFPLAKRVLTLVLKDGGEDKAAEAVAIVEMCFWKMAEQPDIRRQLIALNPRLKPKNERATPSAVVSASAIKGLTSAELFIPAETAASAGAHALDRSMYLLTLLLLNAEDIDGAQHFAKALASSSILLATIMTYQHSSMLQFSVLPVSLKLLDLLWAAVDDGEAMVNKVKAIQFWSGTNFKHLAKRISDDAPDVYMNWPHVKATYIEQ